MLTRHEVDGIMVDLMGKTFDVLDQGFIRVVDYMGGDHSVVQAARISYGAGTKTVSEDRGLIRYLTRHRHTTPFEMASIKFHARAPMDCWRQWIRHRAASVNEYSTRYSEAIDAKAKTEPSKWRTQSKTNKQGSSEYLPIDIGASLSEGEVRFHQAADDLYQGRLAAGVAREQARKDLPLSTYTEAYWKTNLHNLMHFLDLRMDAHAQSEIREFANVIGEQIVSVWCPETWDAFKSYRLNAMTLSSLDQDIIRLVAAGHLTEAVSVARAGALLREDRDNRGVLIRTRECKETEAKLEALGMVVPWPR